MGHWTPTGIEPTDYDDDDDDIYIYIYIHHGPINRSFFAHAITGMKLDTLQPLK